jgi:hypothetical protein
VESGANVGRLGDQSTRLDPRKGRAGSGDSQTLGGDGATERIQVFFQPLVRAFDSVTNSEDASTYLEIDFHQSFPMTKNVRFDLV